MTHRVGVNLLWLVPDDVGGTEEYATRLLSGIAETEPADFDVTLFVLPAFVEAHPEIVEKFRTVAAPIRGSRRILRVLVECTWLAAQARRRRLDLVHHLGGTIPVLRGAPALVTVHDLQPLLKPQTFSGLKLAYLRLMLPWSVKAARRVNAVSEFTADAIGKHLKVAQDRLDVVPHGIDPHVTVSSTAIEDVRHRYRLGDNWFVYPAVTYPFKNHLTLVRAFAALIAEQDDSASQGLYLVLTGRPDSGEAELLGEIDRLGLGDRVRRTGRIPRADVDALIAGSVAVTLPSTFEGFGAPALEAMALATPVIAADAASLPEVVGAAGLLVDPTDIAGWSAAMKQLLHNSAERQCLIEAGAVRAARYGWDSAAQAQLDSWRRALGEESAGHQR